jgi:hypothetical protein
MGIANGNGEILTVNKPILAAPIKLTFAIRDVNQFPQIKKDRMNIIMKGINIPNLSFLRGTSQEIIASDPDWGFVRINGIPQAFWRRNPIAGIHSMLPFARRHKKGKDVKVRIKENISPFLLTTNNPMNIRLRVELITVLKFSEKKCNGYRIKAVQGKLTKVLTSYGCNGFCATW